MESQQSKIVWRSLVNVANINAAVCKLKEINWLYGVVHKDSVDDVYKKVIEITNSATSRMLAKASKSDVSGFQVFTVREILIISSLLTLTLSNINC